MTWFLQEVTSLLVADGVSTDKILKNFWHSSSEDAIRRCDWFIHSVKLGGFKVCQLGEKKKIMKVFELMNIFKLSLRMAPAAILCVSIIIDLVPDLKSTHNTCIWIVFCNWHKACLFIHQFHSYAVIYR